MSLYFSAAVWASLALCVCYSLENYIPRFRTEAAVMSATSNAVANKQHSAITIPALPRSAAAAVRGG
jgi:hypothetical protein